MRKDEPITRGPLGLERPTWEPPEPPVRTVEDEIVRALQAAARWNERERLKATRYTSHDEAAVPHHPSRSFHPPLLTSRKLPGVTLPTSPMT